MPFVHAKSIPGRIDSFVPRLCRQLLEVLALPLSVMSVLIATSKYYNVFQVLHLLIPLAVINLALLVLGTYLIFRSVIRMRTYDRHIQHIKNQHSGIGELID